LDLLASLGSLGPWEGKLSTETPNCHCIPNRALPPVQALRGSRGPGGAPNRGACLENQKKTSIAMKKPMAEKEAIQFVF